MQASRAKLFKNGSSQAVRLPKDFRMPGVEVHIRKIGQAVVLLPLKNPWGSLFESLEMFSDDFMNKRTQPRAERRRLRG